MSGIFTCAILGDVMAYADRFSKRTNETPMNMRLVTFNLYPDLYKFLNELGAIPLTQREMTEQQTDYNPSNGSLFTAYKSLLHYIILCNYLQPPLQGRGLGITESTAIYSIYEARAITPPSDDQIREIANELKRIAKGYVQMVNAKARGEDVGI